MEEIKEREAKEANTTFYFRRITRSGKTRYLSLGSILPGDWEACKVYAKVVSDEVVVLRLEKIS